ncbi:MAG: multicopper oxidase domain-containing protein, partial [Methylocella sp.]
MFRAYIFKCFGGQLVSFMRAAALPAALCTTWATACAQAQSDLPANLERLPAPSVAPPVNRKNPAKVKVARVAVGIGYHYWTYNGTVPGPMIRVRQGDTVELTLHNALESPVSHSIDSHGVLGPGGGGKVTQTPPGATSLFQFKATHPGVFIYHCATPMIPYHLSHGMYGLMVVEPPGGWPKVD